MRELFGCSGVYSHPVMQFSSLGAECPRGGGARRSNLAASGAGSLQCDDGLPALVGKPALATTIGMERSANLGSASSAIAVPNFSPCMASASIARRSGSTSNDWIQIEFRALVYILTLLFSYILAVLSSAIH